MALYPNAEEAVLETVQCGFESHGGYVKQMIEYGFEAVHPLETSEALSGRSNVLEQEGMVNDLIREVNQLRRKRGLDLTDKVHLCLVVSEGMWWAIYFNVAYLLESTRASGLTFFDSNMWFNEVELYGGEKVRVTI